MSFSITDKRGTGTRASGSNHGEEAAFQEQQTPPWFPVFLQFEAERVAQIEKWGDQRGQREDGPLGHPHFVTMAEEFQRQNDARERDGKPGVWTRILQEELYEAFSEPVGPKLFHELRQSGAVITAWMEDLIFRGVVEL